MLKDKELEALRKIRNFIAHIGRTPSIKDYKEILGYKSSRSVYLMLNALIDGGVIEKQGRGKIQVCDESPNTTSHTRTVDVQFFGNVACGTPTLAVTDVEKTIAVSTDIAKPPNKYFFLRAKGDSMNLKGIQPGDLVLVRQQPDADNGSLVVALIDGEATIKEYHATSESVVLKPQSSNPENKPIILTRDFQIQGVVVKVVPDPDKLV